MPAGAAPLNPRRRLLLASGIAWSLPWRPPAIAQPRRIDAMQFSGLRAGGPLPVELKPWEFGGQSRATRYSLVADEGTVVLRAEADASTSGIVREIQVDPRENPILAWRWKVMNLLERADIRTRRGDDFPARVYVTFAVDPAALPPAERAKLSFARLMYGDKVPAAALCYVWDGKAVRDTLVPNAYTERVRMIVAESGAARLGTWVQMRRNIRDDYKRAFGAEPAAATSVIVSTDTDNTGESAVAYYGDISFGPS